MGGCYQQSKSRPSHIILWQPYISQPPINSLSLPPSPALLRRHLLQPKNMVQSTESPLLTNTSMIVKYGPVVCEPMSGMVSKDVFLGDNPMKYTLPLLTSQIGLLTLLSTILRLLLMPLSQPEYVADILVMCINLPLPYLLLVFLLFHVTSPTTYRSMI